MSVGPDYADRNAVVTLTLRLDDVTDATAKEFVRRLSEPGYEIEMTLSDGREYSAVIE